MVRSTLELYEVQELGTRLSHPVELSWSSGWWKEDRTRWTLLRKTARRLSMSRHSMVTWTRARFFWITARGSMPFSEPAEVTRWLRWMLLSIEDIEIARNWFRCMAELQHSNLECVTPCPTKVGYSTKYRRLMNVSACQRWNLTTEWILVFTAKLRVKHVGSSTASDSSSFNHRHPELYYEERRIERRMQRKANLRKLARRDSRSFSEEEVRMSSKRDERRARSESAR